MEEYKDLIDVALKYLKKPKYSVLYQDNPFWTIPATFRDKDYEIVMKDLSIVGVRFISGTTAITINEILENQ